MRKIPHIFFGLLLMCTAGCMQTKTLVTEADEDLSRIEAPTYLGCFASFISYDKYNRRAYNDSVTRLCKNICDSLMHEGFRKIPKPVSPPIPDSAQAKAMGIDFLAIINKALQHQSIKNYRCGESFAKLTAPYNAEHFLFLIPCGYTRMAENPKQPPKAVTPAQIVGTHLASTKLSDDSTANFMFFPNGQQMHAQESNIYALIYHKSSGRFTWYRQQFFLKEKIHPMQRKYLKKQLDYLLKEYL